jgi:pimeloyl-ACP methyl ester carboxylesterase
MGVQKIPLIYVRGYAGTQADVEETVDDPFYGFNVGSTHIRQDQTGSAVYFAFQSPFVRLARDHGYNEVFEGSYQAIGSKCPDPNRTVWIYRYYDPTSKTFDRPGGRRLTIEEAAAHLGDFIEYVLKQPKVTATKVYLVAHSMGGLVCRSLLEKHYPENSINPNTKVAKLFTFGTPHGGIHFDIGAGAIEKVRDLLGANQSNDFGRERMYRYLTPLRKQQKNVPKKWDPRTMESFDPGHVFCVVGTNAHDYEVAHGLSRSLVGPQSDGLVQIESAYVHRSPRTYIHRSHSGRYGMVNSEEGYQNLQRFLFGDVKVDAMLSDFSLDYAPRPNEKKATVTYLFEVQLAIRGLVILMHESSTTHLCAISLDKDEYTKARRDGLPLFTTFLLDEDSRENAMRFMFRVGVYRQVFQKGILFMEDHLECLPTWSDYLIVDIRLAAKGSKTRYDTRYRWASEGNVDMHELEIQNPSQPRSYSFAPLLERGRQILGQRARIRFDSSDWS